MTIFLIIIHVIVCIALIMIVLLQTGKGADMGAAFGGGASQTLFGSTGASTFLNKATTVVAVVFMCTCVTLAYFSGKKDAGSVIDNVAPITVPAPSEPAQTEPAPAAEPEAETQTNSTTAEATVETSGESEAEAPAMTDAAAETTAEETVDSNTSTEETTN